MARKEAITDEGKADREAILGILEAGANLVMAFIDFANNNLQAISVRTAAKNLGTKVIDFAEEN